MPVQLYPPAQRLLSLPDVHGALLAEFDFFAEQQVLWVRWHGHLTGAAVVRGAQAAQRLRHEGRAPQRILNDNSHATGDWSEALPWVQYEWLPEAVASGLRAMAYVLSPDPVSQPNSHEFAQAVRRLIPLSIFRHPGPGWRWLGRHG